MNSLQNFALDNDLVLEAGDASYTPTPGQNQNQLAAIATQTGIYAALAEGKLAVLANYKLGTRMLVAQIRRRKLQIELLRHAIVCISIAVVSHQPKRASTLVKDLSTVINQAADSLECMQLAVQPCLAVLANKQE